MLLLESFAAQFRDGGTPPIVDTALPCSAAEESLEIIGIAAAGLGSEGVLGGSEFLLEEGGPVFGVEGFTARAAEAGGFAEAHENFGQPFLPENIFNGDGDEQGVLDAAGEMTEPGSELQGTFTDVGKAALGGEGEEIIGRLQNGFGGTEKLNGAATGALLDAEEA